LRPLAMLRSSLLGIQQSHCQPHFNVIPLPVRCEHRNIMGIEAGNCALGRWRERLARCIGPGELRDIERCDPTSSHRAVDGCWDGTEVLTNDARLRTVRFDAE